jgi:chromosome segregation ATPase
VPRIEEVQFVHWGCLRPDPVPLLTDGINVATGPNGAGKSCFLDGLKLLLGVSELGAGRGVGDYLFDGGPSGVAAGKAFLRATFANPAPVSGPRPFAAAGSGCQDADRVSVVCEVTAGEHRYRVLPGLVRWGAERRIRADLRAFEEANPDERWIGPRRYQELLAQAGVNRAQRAVLALPQGAIDRLVEERPAGLLRRLLELAGEGATDEAVRVRRERRDGAHAALLAAEEQLGAEHAHLEALDELAARATEWTGLRDRLDQLRQVVLPAARYRELAARARTVGAEVDRQARLAAADQSLLDALAERIPEREAAARALGEQADGLERQLDEVHGALRTIDARAGAAEAAAARAGGAASDPARAEADAGAAETALHAALTRRRETAASLEDHQAEVAALAEGRPLPPPEVEAFRTRLAAEGVGAVPVAELLDLPAHAGETVRAQVEAALGEALWALVVPSEDYRRATELAVEAGYRLGIARTGSGEPSGVLARVDAPIELGLLLERADAWAAENARQGHDLAALGRPAVAPNGVRYGDSISRLQRPARPVIGRGARAQRLRAARAEVARLTAELAALDDRIPVLRADWRHAVLALDAAGDRGGPDGAPTLEELELLRPPLRKRARRLQREARETAERQGAAGAELAGERARQSRAKARLARNLPRLDELRGMAAGLESELAGHHLSAEQRAAVHDDALPGVDAAAREAKRLAALLDDDRFGPEVRDPEVPRRRDAQAEAVLEAERTAADRRGDAVAFERDLDEARRHYEERVRGLLGELSAEFDRLCRSCGAEGELRLVAGDRHDELGVDVLVAHLPGEPLRSYREGVHSGGQRAKVALLLTLAALGPAGAADVLVMDEHVAHLDSATIDRLAELMHARSDQVQFVLAMPSNAEALRLSWCDLQLAFLPRNPGEPYGPPVRLLSRLGAGDFEARFQRGELTAS